MTMKLTSEGDKLICSVSMEDMPGWSNALFPAPERDSVEDQKSKEYSERETLKIMDDFNSMDELDKEAVWSELVKDPHVAHDFPDLLAMMNAIIGGNEPARPGSVRANMGRDPMPAGVKKIARKPIAKAKPQPAVSVADDDERHDAARRAPADFFEGDMQEGVRSI